MKRIIAMAALSLVATAANAGELTQDDVDHCLNARRIAEITVKKKAGGQKKHELYKIVADIEMPDSDRKLYYTVIDQVFSGRTPDDVFDFCVDVNRKFDPEPAKSGRVGL